MILSDMVFVVFHDDSTEGHEVMSCTIFNRIHGTGIFTYIYHKKQPNVGEYTIQGSYGYLMRFNKNTSYITFCTM